MSKTFRSSLIGLFLLGSLFSLVGEEEKVEKPMLKDKEWKMVGGKLILVRKQVKKETDAQESAAKAQSVIDIKLNQQKAKRKKKDEKVKVKWKWVNGKLVSEVQYQEPTPSTTRRGPLIEVPHAKTTVTKKVRFKRGKNLDNHEVELPFTGKTFIKDVNKLHNQSDGTDSKSPIKKKAKSQ